MNRHDEDSLQESCVTWFRLQYPKLAQMLIAVPNGGKRNAFEASRLKRQGVTPGVCDLLLLTPRHGFGCLCIEMKTKRGCLTDKQDAWIAECNKYNMTFVARSLEDFQIVINSYLKQ